MGICLVLFFVIQEVAVFLMSATGFYPFYQENAAFQYAFGAVFSTFLALFVPFFFKSLKKGGRSYIGVLPFEGAKKKYVAVSCVALGLAVCIAANYAAAFVDGLLSDVGVDVFVPENVKSADVWQALLNLVCTAAIPALAEEFVFRGVIMQPLRRYGEHFAVIATAVIFGLAHGSPTSFVFAFTAGVAMGYAAVISGSLWVGIAVHFLNNAFSVTLSELYNFFPGMSDSIYLIIQSVIFTLGLGGAVVLAVMRPYKFNKSSVSGFRLSVGKRMKGFFLCIPMLIAIAIFIYYISLSIV